MSLGFSPPATKKEPRTENPGLNVNVAASLLGQFGNDKWHIGASGTPSY